MDWTQRMINGLAKLLYVETDVPKEKRDRPLIDRIMKARGYLADRRHRKPKRGSRATTSKGIHES